MRKNTLKKQPRVYEAKRDFSTSRGGGGYIMSGNPLSGGGGG